MLKNLLHHVLDLEEAALHVVHLICSHIVIVLGLLRFAGLLVGKSARHIVGRASPLGLLVTRMALLDGLHLLVSRGIQLHKSDELRMAGLSTVLVIAYKPAHITTILDDLREGLAQFGRPEGDLLLGQVGEVHLVDHFDLFLLILLTCHSTESLGQLVVLGHLAG